MRVLTSERAEPTANPQDPRVFATSCPDRELDLPRPPSCLRELRRLRGMVLGTPSPVLFSSADQAVPSGEEEIGYLGQDGAGGGESRTSPGGSQQNTWGLD